MNQRSNWNYELIAALSAVFIGACALVASIVQTRVMLRQESAAVWPIVHWDFSIHSDHIKGTGNFELYAENKGVGPAIIEQAQLKYKGQSFVEDSIRAIVLGKMLTFKGERNMQVDQASLNGTILAPNERKYMIRVDLGTGGDTLAAQFLQAMFREDLDVMICYKNIYDQFWTVRKQNKVTEVRKCQ